MPSPTNLDHPIVILIRGLPGSGKSYLAEALVHALSDYEVMSLDPDAIDFDGEAYAAHKKAQEAEGVDEKLWPYRFLRAQAYAGIEQHKIVIWNQPFTNLEMFDKITARFREFASEHGIAALPIVVVEVDVDRTEAKTRVDDRKADGGHGPSDNTFDRFHREYESVASRGYDVVAVHGQRDINDSVAAVTQHISRFLEQ